MVVLLQPWRYIRIMKTEIEKVIDIFEGQANMARLLGVSANAISKWVAQGRVPPRRVLQIMRFVGRKNDLGDGVVTLQSLLAESCSDTGL